MVFEMLQEVIELLLAAAAVGVDLHLVGDALRHPRFNVVQVHMPLLWAPPRDEEKEGNVRADREKTTRTRK